MSKVLVIGSGGREDVIATTFLKSPQVDKVYCAPGNPGMVAHKIICVNIAELNFKKLLSFCKNKNINLIFVGPELPLAKGIVDYFSSKGFKIFGPDKKSSRLESDKKFAKEFMRKNKIPTAEYKSFTNYLQAKKYADKIPSPMVIKENGLAGGKGVTITRNKKEIPSIIKKSLKKSGKILIENFLKGEEFSIFLFISPDNEILSPFAQDHKKLYKGEKGPNTGGMGAYSPIPHINKNIKKQVIKNIIKPTINGLKKEKYNYTGVIYIGCILTQKGPKVIEYNVRLGDPETQVLLPQLKSDFYQLVISLINNRKPKIKWQKDNFYLGVTVCAPGYPSHPKQNIFIPNLPQNVFYAGILEKNKKRYSSGGRIFTIVDHKKDLLATQKRVYQELDKINLNNFYYRKDIGYKDL